MNYELAKQLKDAGFPQGMGTHVYPEQPPPSKHAGIVYGVYVPTLEELIEACGDKFVFLNRVEWKKANPDWEAGGKNLKKHHAIASTPTEAVARLWLALNKHD